MAAPKNGSLIRQTGTDPIYLVVFGDRCLVPDQATYDNLFLPTAVVHDLTQQEMDAVPPGPDLTSGAILAAVTGDPPVYLMSWGMASHIQSPSVFGQFGFDEQKIRHVPPGIIAGVYKGWTITA